MTKHPRGHWPPRTTARLEVDESIISEDGPDVIVYADGSCDAEGHGGAAAVLLSPRTGRVMEVGQSVPFDATNQRMEILAVIIAFKCMSCSAEVKVISDSKYVIDCFNDGWIDNWLRKGWRAGRGKPVANREYWETLYGYVLLHDVEWEWVKGHAGDKYNEKADMLAGAYRYRAHQEELQKSAQASAREYRATGGVKQSKRAMRDGTSVAQRRRRVPSAR